jgi:hypothetical protein
MNTNGLIFFEAEMPHSSNRSVPLVQNGGFSPNMGAPLSPADSPNDSPNPPTSGYYRVWHIPDFLAEVEGYVFDGPCFIPVDFKDYVDKVDDIEVLLNGVPTSFAEFTYITNTSGDKNWSVGIYFDRITNGTYQMQLATTLRLGDDVDDTTYYLSLTNQAATISVSNQVIYTNWNDLILSDSYTFNAQTLNTNTAWQIDIYDAWGYYVNSGFGATTNGQIAWIWDLYEYWGDSRANSDTDPYFQGFITFTTDAGAGGKPTTRPTPSPAAQYPSVGGWLISYCDRHYLDAGTNYAGADTYYQTAMLALAGGPSLKGDPNTLFAIKFGTNYAQSNRDLSWLGLKSDIYQPVNRNFYYYGHGSATDIDCDQHTFDSSNYVSGGKILPNSKAFLTSKWVHDNVTFNEYGGVHRYRFVFLDGCNTANGDWPDAFGIGKVGYPTPDWYSSTNNTKHVRPGAFVGWNQTVGGGGWGTAKAMFQWLSYWMGNWANGTPDVTTLHDALESANQSAGWVPQAQLDGALVIYGYRYLLIEDYNHNGDWRWP